MTTFGQSAPDAILTERRRLLGLPLTRTQYVLQGNPLQQRIGLLSPVTRSVNVSQIRRVAAHQTFFQKRLGLTTIHVATDDPLISELVIVNVRNGNLFEKQLRRYAEENQTQQLHTMV